MNTILPVIPSGDDVSLPLPLIVAQKWNFPLAHVKTDDGYFYAIQDWIRGITGEKKTKTAQAQMKKKLLVSIRKFPYRASDGRTYHREFVDAEALLKIAHYLRSTSHRIRLNEIKAELFGIQTSIYLHTSHQQRRSELKDVHRYVVNWLLNHKCPYVHEFKMPEYGRADFVFYPDNHKTKVIECKLTLSRSARQDVLQLLGYWHQISADGGMLACFNNGSDIEFASRICREYAVDLLVFDFAGCVVAEMIGAQAQQTATYLQMDLATGKPLLSFSNEG